MTYTLGLDLGTTASAVAINVAGDVSMFSSGHRDLVIGSVVYIGADGTVLVGEAAERRATSDPGGVAREFKRRFGDPQPLILSGSPVSANDLMVELAKHLVAKASEQRGEAPEEIVVCHPANWGDYKLALLGDTLANSSLPPHRLISEPEAAAIHDAAQDELDPGSIVAVYDLGGGTFDVALLRKLTDGWEPVGRPGGIERLGGIDFDTAVLQHVVDSLKLDLGSYESDDTTAQTAMFRLRDECRAAKHALSEDTATAIPVLLPGVNETVRITREEFEGLIGPAIRRTLEMFDATVASASIEMTDIARILLVGGSSQIPVVRQRVMNHTHRPLSVDRHPKHTIALGAATSTVERAPASPAPAPVVAETPDVPPAESPDPVKEMYDLPHISEAPLPDFLSRGEIAAPAPVAPAPRQPPPRLVAPAPAQPTVIEHAGGRPQQQHPPTSIPPTAESSHSVQPGESTSNVRRGGGFGFWLAVLILAGIAGGATYYFLREAPTDSSSATADDAIATDDTGSTDEAATDQDPTSTSGGETPTPTFATSCPAEDLPDPNQRYRVSDPDDGFLNGRNVPSLTQVAGVQSTPLVTFLAQSELDLTYQHCEVDEDGRVWWGVQTDQGVVWSSTRFIEPVP